MVPTPKNPTPRNRSLTPITVAIVGTIGSVESKALLKALLDPGSTKTLVNKKIVPELARPAKLNKGIKVKTIAGTMKTSEMVKLRNLQLPEFDKN